MSTLKVKLYFDADSWVGPGKAELLEAIAAHGSISAAGRSMGMSYKRAWDHIAAMNRIFGAPVATAKAGGRRGGGAELTPLGREVVAHFRAIEAAAANAAAVHVRKLEDMRAAPDRPVDAV